MVNYGIVIIVVGVFFAGIGIGYAIFPSSTPITPMMTPQQMQQMMNDPDQMFQWHHAMINDPQVMDSWMDTIVNKPELRQKMIDKMDEEAIEEFQELDESTSLLEKKDFRAMLLKQMEEHNQNLANFAPFYSDDPNLTEIMNEKMVEHNQLMNQLLNQETIESELEESIQKHVEDHQELAEQIASFNQNG
jgi:hypothetical protein